MMEYLMDEKTGGADIFAENSISRHESFDVKRHFFLVENLLNENTDPQFVFLKY